MKQYNRMPVFRERLRELMGEMSVTEFANDVGLSRQTLGFYLNGNRIPDCETLAQICKKCNVSANWLLGLSNTKSLEANVEAVIQYTGLAEDNVNFLHDPSAFGRDEPLNAYRKSLFTLVNDLIELCQLFDVHGPFFQIQELLSSFENKTARDGGQAEQLIAESAAKKWGYAVLPVNDSIAFYSSQLSRALERAIVKKYSISQASEPSGRCEPVEVNGRTVKLWKE